MYGLPSPFNFTVNISRQARQTYNSDGILECWVWCGEKFGIIGDRWNWDTYKSFFFVDSHDALLFSLRWN